MSEATPRVAAYTWRRQWKAEICTGIVAGASGLAGFAAMRSLGAPTWTPQLLAIAGQVPWLFAPGLEALTSRFDARRAFIWLGVAANVPLLLLALLPVEAAGEHGTGTGPVLPFVAAIVVLTALDGLYIPLRSAMIRANFAEAIRGRFFAWLNSVSRSATVASSKLGGFLLDADARFLRIYYPLAGIAGLCEHVLISRIRWHRSEVVRPADGGRMYARFVASLREGLEILRADRDFRIYEIGFLLYGTGFLMSSPLLAEFTESSLRLSYAQVTWAVGFTDPLAYVAAGLIVGPQLQRLGVVPVTCGAFLVLSFFFSALVFVQTPAAFVALNLFFGAAMAGVNLGWNLGPLRFAPKGRARAYAAVHLLMVGVRIAIGPAAGYALSRWTDIRLVFGVSAVLISAGAVTTGLLARRVR